MDDDRLRASRSVSRTFVATQYTRIVQGPYWQLFRFLPYPMFTWLCTLSKRAPPYDALAQRTSASKGLVVRRKY